MNHTRVTQLLGLMAGMAAAGNAYAAVVMVGDPTAGAQAADRITVSTTWTANNTYNLQDQIWVMPGATLTIEAGTVIASDTHPSHLGSLAVCKGAQIFVNGTQTNPVIMTSSNDVATWDPLAGHPTGRDPRTGHWRAVCQEWGNLTVMGEAFIGAGPPKYPNNVPTCNVNNVAAMEGLLPASGHESDVLYGGNQDNDDSGSIHYLSLRYGGKVIAVTNELNGLSLGGLGRNTEIDHVDIMNNVDDGIEIWGGTVNLKFLNIWNIGDDCFDVDQGWRGKAQFGLLVQGYSIDAGQGGGIGDNIFEIDGAEDSDAQPVTTCTIYNFTAIGQPIAGDQGTAWRANARVQYRNCIFMDLGEWLIKNDNSDGDAIPDHGYGFNGTLTFCDEWTTAYTEHSLVNACTNPDQRYQAQSAGDSSIHQGFLAEMTDSVFFRNLGQGGAPTGGAYSDSGNIANSAGNCRRGSDSLNVTNNGGSEPTRGNVVAAYVPATPNLNMPIVALGRAADVLMATSVPPNQPERRVNSIDPRAANAATTSISAAPADGFFTPAQYRGAFSPTQNWLCNWTAADAYGFNVPPPAGCALCAADIDGSGSVDVNDLLSVITHWGACPAPCPPHCTGDVAPAGGDCAVNVNDLLSVITTWGPCS